MLEIYIVLKLWFYFNDVIVRINRTSWEWSFFGITIFFFFYYTLPDGSVLIITNFPKYDTLRILFVCTLYTCPVSFFFSNIIHSDDDLFIFSRCASFYPPQILSLSSRYRLSLVRSPFYLIFKSSPFPAVTILRLFLY